MISQPSEQTSHDHPTNNTERKNESPVTRDEEQTCESFQQAVSQYLIRHRSVLDIISKFQEANARVNRAVAKAVTSCGCVQIDADRQSCPSDISIWEMKDHMKTHVKGKMCEQCHEILEQEVGRNLFYLTAICDVFDLKLGQVIDGERRRLSTLGVFNLT